MRIRLNGLKLKGLAFGPACCVNLILLSQSTQHARLAQRERTAPFVNKALYRIIKVPSLNTMPPQTNPNLLPRPPSLLLLHLHHQHPSPTTSSDSPKSPSHPTKSYNITIKSLPRPNSYNNIYADKSKTISHPNTSPPFLPTNFPPVARPGQFHLTKNQPHLPPTNTAKDLLASQSTKQR